MVPLAPHPLSLRKTCRPRPRPHETKTIIPVFRRGRNPPGPGAEARLHAASASDQLLPGPGQVFPKGLRDHLFAPPGVVENTGVLRKTPQGMRPLPAHLRMGDHLQPRQRSGTGARGFGPFDQRCLAPRRQRRGSRYWRFGEGPRPHLNSTIRGSPSSAKTEGGRGVRVAPWPWGRPWPTLRITS